MRDYRFDGRTVFASDTDPSVPSALAEKIQAVIGLSSFASPQTNPSRVRPAWANFGTQWNNFLVPIINGLNNINSATQIKSGSRNPSTFLPATIQVAFPWIEPDEAQASSDPPATWINVDGTGQTIGLVEFDSFNPSDVADWLALKGKPASLSSHVSKVDVNGGTPIGAGEPEVLIDIVGILGIAPGAQTVVYSAPFTNGSASFQAVFNKMLTDGVSVISNSWFYCEGGSNLADALSIDSIMTSAAAAGVSVFNATGDSGAVCGGAEGVALPASSPNATAVGGSSIAGLPGMVYGSESWWDSAAATPPGGQGSFGTSVFFSTPDYQSGLSSGGRSVPDVVANADPTKGIPICQADAGGCPTPQLYGGTSLAAPEWAAFAALLNQGQGTNLGFLNPLIYPFANTSAFHSASDMGSDFTHVGLGSPNLNVLHVALSSSTVGPVSATLSQVEISDTLFLANPVPADPTTTYVVVTLRDDNGNTVSGKTVSLSKNAGSSATITPSSAVTTVANGAAVFTVTNPNRESTTFRATADGVTLSETATTDFPGPPAVSETIGALPSSVVNDGVTSSVITVTLTDYLGRPAPKKVVQLTQTGSSVIKGPTPSETDNNGEIQFLAVDQVPETITYTAVDVTDGNVAFADSAVVTFTGNPGNGCGNGTPPAAPGFVATPYATGFFAQQVSFGGVNFGCRGVAGLAFDASGNLFVSYLPNGAIYKFPPGGGVASSTTLLTQTPLGPSLANLAFDASGNLYAGRNATTGNFTTGAVYQVNANDGTIVKTVAENLTCPGTIAIDPLTGDLFADDSCSGAGSDNPALWRVKAPASATPSLGVYMNLPGTPNATLAFAPSGTLYAWAFTGLNGSGIPAIAEISGTNGPATPTVSFLPNNQLAGLGLLARGVQNNGDAESLFLNPFNAALNETVGTTALDLTTSPPATSATLVNKTGTNTMAFGPDGCIYAAQPDNVYRITDTNGDCNYAVASQPASLYLSPVTISPNPSQGNTETFTATVHYGSVPDGTAVLLTVNGANKLVLQANTSGGVASFSYVGQHQGVDNLNASATVDGAPVTSNQSVVTWGPGTHSTAVTLNLSPTTGSTGQPVTLVANLTDISQSPVVALSGRQISFTLGSTGCSGATDSKGNASCQVTPTGAGVMTMTATFAGVSGQFNPSSDSKFFNLVSPPVIPTPVPTATPTLRPTASPTASPTAQPTAAPTASPTPRPTASPTVAPTHSPTPTRTATPTPSPTPTRTAAPTRSPTPTRTATPTPKPTPTPTARPTQSPTPVGSGTLLILPPFLQFVSDFDGDFDDLTLLPVVVTDVSKFTVQFEKVSVSGAPFSIKENRCTGSLAPGHVCKVLIQFSPKQSGNFTGKLTFTDTAKGSPQSIPLYGKAFKKHG